MHFLLISENWVFSWNKTWPSQKFNELHAHSSKTRPKADHYQQRINLVTFLVKQVPSSLGIDNKIEHQVIFREISFAAILWEAFIKAKFTHKIVKPKLMKYMLLLNLKKLKSKFGNEAKLVILQQYYSFIKRHIKLHETTRKRKAFNWHFF